MDKPATNAHIEQAPKALHVRHPQSQDHEVSPVDEVLPTPALSESTRAVVGSRPVGAAMADAKNIAMACNILSPGASVLELTTETYPVLGEVNATKMVEIERVSPHPMPPPTYPHSTPTMQRELRAVGGTVTKKGRAKAADHPAGALQATPGGTAHQVAPASKLFRL